MELKLYTVNFVRINVITGMKTVIVIAKKSVCHAEGNFRSNLINVRTIDKINYENFNLLYPISKIKPK